MSDLYVPHVVFGRTKMFPWVEKHLLGPNVNLGARKRSGEVLEDPLQDQSSRRVVRFSSYENNTTVSEYAHYGD